MLGADDHSVSTHPTLAKTWVADLEHPSIHILPLSMKFGVVHSPHKWWTFWWKPWLSGLDFSKIAWISPCYSLFESFFFDYAAFRGYYPQAVFESFPKIQKPPRSGAACHRKGGRHHQRVAPGEGDGNGGFNKEDLTGNEQQAGNGWLIYWMVNWWLLMIHNGLSRSLSSDPWHD